MKEEEEEEEEKIKAKSVGQAQVSLRSSNCLLVLFLQLQLTGGASLMLYQLQNPVPKVLPGLPPSAAAVPSHARRFIPKGPHTTPPPPATVTETERLQGVHIHFHYRFPVLIHTSCAPCSRSLQLRCI
jgi:hypothetical protein